MNTEIKIIPDEAKTVYINHPTASYGIFCYNSQGDLFLSSDWGFFGYAWRHHGQKTFREFLERTDEHYLTDKLAINWNNGNRSKSNRFGGQRETNVKILVKEFINFLRTSKADGSTI